MRKEISILIILIIALVILAGCTNNIESPPISEKNITCEDFDGKDYYLRGQIEVCDFTTLEEPEATSPIGCALHEDFCPEDPTGNELYEYYCEANELKFEKYTCPNGCQDGACIKNPPEVQIEEITPTDKESCETRGGEWTTLSNHPNATDTCNLPTSDGGKKCTDISQCESFCQVPWDTEIGAKAEGECYKFKLSDRVQTVKNGVLVGQIWS
jgi:hypothetical protein